MTISYFTFPLLNSVSQTGAWLHPRVPVKRAAVPLGDSEPRTSLTFHFEDHLLEEL